jgi:hypothetical protein
MMSGMVVPAPRSVRMSYSLGYEKALAPESDSALVRAKPSLLTRARGMSASGNEADQLDGRCYVSN